MNTCKKITETGFLAQNFNRKKNYNVFNKTNDVCRLNLQNMAKNQCLGKSKWPEITNVNAWMLSAETATFMKWGGLGMVASELPENFNRTFYSKKNIPLSHKC